MTEAITKEHFTEILRAHLEKMEASYREWALQQLFLKVAFNDSYTKTKARDVVTYLLRTIIVNTIPGNAGWEDLRAIANAKVELEGQVSSLTKSIDESVAKITAANSTIKRLEDELARETQTAQTDREALQLKLGGKIAALEQERD